MTNILTKLAIACWSTALSLGVILAIPVRATTITYDFTVSDFAGPLSGPISGDLKGVYTGSFSYSDDLVNESRSRQQIPLSNFGLGGLLYHPDFLDYARADFKFGEFQGLDVYFKPPYGHFNWSIRGNYWQTSHLEFLGEPPYYEVVLDAGAQVKYSLTSPTVPTSVPEGNLTTGLGILGVAFLLNRKIAASQRS
jgi:hypothetical protein